MKILESKTIYRDENAYVAFPNLARLKDDTIICAFRHARERISQYGKRTHIDPSAQDVFIVSPDGGNSFDTDIHLICKRHMSSIQDPCVNVLSNGRIIVTYFQWLLVPIGDGAETWGEDNFRRYGRTVFDKYDSYPGGAYYSISDNNGRTWMHQAELIVEGAPSGVAVRGNILELPNGDLLMPYYSALKVGELSSCGLFRSTDKGISWENYSIMAFDETCQKNYLEANIFRTQSGRIVGLYRTQTDWTVPGVKFDDTYLNLHISVSDDDGKTFGPVEEIPDCWGSNPFHALQLKSGKVLLTYGHRKAPYGIRARLCNSELTDIAEAEELILRDDSANGDLGYPNAIQLDNGDILVTYYIVGEDEVRTIDVTRLRED